MARVDKELAEYRSLMEVPDTFEDGFSGSSLVGALFLGLIMIPGSLYMELLAGMGVGPAAQWVTVILFIEVAKRANAKLSRAQIFILFYMAGAIVGQQVHGTPLFRQFLVNSEAAVTTGISTLFPSWVAPPAGSDAYNQRSFFQLAWLPVIGLIAFRMFFSKLDNAVLGYGLFRRTSDVE
ncbi:MAG: peptide transporter, partial [Planctomycetes bacterium]|nr:peptide transporter [Planctomycetota bacterium]